MRLVQRLVLVLALVLPGCSMRDSLDPESGVRVFIEDPTGRLGPAPWAVAVFNPYLGPEEALAAWAKGTAQPGKPYVVLGRADEDVWRILDMMPSDGSRVGLVLPALRRDGYWLARLGGEPPRGDTQATAHFCRWGSVVPEDGAEALGVRASPVKKDYGLEYEVTVRVPAAGTP